MHTFVTAVVTVVLSLVATTATATPHRPPAQTSAAVVSVTRPFATTSPFNVPVRTAPRIDAKSAAMITQIGRAGLGYANLVEYGIPIFVASSTTPRLPVNCTITTWGPCQLEVGPRPSPTNAAPNSGSDGVMTIIDPVANTVDEYWQADRTSAGWNTSWGSISSLSGSGWGSTSTGAGASRLAGVVRISEIAAGQIPHALVLQSDTACAKVFRAPATKTDGLSTRTDCVPEGARLQLDPAINVAAIPNITPGERAVARALQVYGAYLIDRADTPLSVSFELAPDASSSSPGTVYQKAGFAWDYFGMPHIPWKKLRVLASATG